MVKYNSRHNSSYTRLNWLKLTSKPVIMGVNRLGSRWPGLGDSSIEIESMWTHAGPPVKAPWTQLVNRLVCLLS